MNALILKAGENTPSIRLDATKGIFEISGNSRPENVAVFYKPAMDWLNVYAQSPNEQTVFDFKLKYFNTASSKIIYDIMMKLSDIHRAGKSVTIRWHYQSGDDDIEYVGKDFSEIVEFPIEMVEY